MTKVRLLLAALIAIAQVLKATPPIVHAYRSGAAGIYSNSYVIEMQKGVVIVDATLSVSSAKEVAGIVGDIGKPIYAILITHGHPDHYNGLTQILSGQNVPVYSTQGVLDVIKKYDDAKEKRWKPVFGEEWPAKRTFPNRIIEDRETIQFEDVTFTVFDLGAGESHSDSYWVMQHDGIKYAFIGDVVLYKVHAYLTDGHVAEWLKHLDDLKRTLADVSILYPGHGLPGGLTLLDWQKRYIECYLTNLKPLWSDRQITEAEKIVLTEKMKAFLPNDKLAFLIGLGAEPVAQAVFK